MVHFSVWGLGFQVQISFRFKLILGVDLLLGLAAPLGMRSEILCCSSSSSSSRLRVRS